MVGTSAGVGWGVGAILLDGVAVGPGLPVTGIRDGLPVGEGLGASVGKWPQILP